LFNEKEKKKKKKMKQTKAINTQETESRRRA
jgi:hypothetical protein